MNDYRTDREKEFMKNKEIALAHRDLYIEIDKIQETIKDVLGVNNE